MIFDRERIPNVQKIKRFGKRMPAFIII